MDNIILNDKQQEMVKALDEKLKAILNDPAIPVPGCGAMAFQDGKLLYQNCMGYRTFDASGKVGVKPFTADTRYRIASISKMFSALCVMRLVEQGTVDLDEDVSKYLGFTLRNPNYPEQKITLRMLMSHTSTIRDGSGYMIAPEYRIEECFLPDGKYYRGGEHFANSDDGINREPGRFFTYANLNYGIIGTMFERLSGLRFDEYLKKNILEPMGIGASFNVGDFDEENIGLLSPLYEAHVGDKWDPSQPWVAQVDDYKGQVQPRDKVRITDPDGNSIYADLNGYNIGNNGTLFSPQGGLRISMNELKVLAELYLNDGKVNGRQIVSKESLDTMFTPYWTYDRAAQNGDTYGGQMACYGPGVQTMTSEKDKDIFLKDRKVVLSGHFGEAFGLLAGLFVNRKTKMGIFYVINGQGAPMSEHRGDYSGMYQWEEHLCTAILDTLFPDIRD